MENLPFCELVNCLMWLSSSTRPGISNSVRAVAIYCIAPKATHWKAALGILEYIKGTHIYTPSSILASAPNWGENWPFRELVDSLMWRSSSTRPDISNSVRAVARNCIAPKATHWKAALGILEYIKGTHTHTHTHTIVNPCTGSNLGNAARHVGKNLADAVERKKNKCRGSFPAIYCLLPLVISTCGEVGSDVHTLIKELAIRRVEHRSETHSNESQHLAEGTEVAHRRRRFFFVLP